MDIAPYKKPEYFRNRELSWVSFDERVLNEARDKSIPLFERLKFISITSSNLDEFYMVRVASLKDQVHANYTKKDLSGMDAKEQLAAVMERYDIQWEQKGTHEKHLSVLDYKKQEREKEVAALDTTLAEKQDELEKVQSRIDNFDQGVQSIEKLEQRIETDAEFQLPDPPTLMTAKTYKQRFVDPLIKKLKEVIREVFYHYYKALDSYHRLNTTNGRLYRENEHLTATNDRLKGENDALRSELKDFRFLRKVLGSQQIDNLIAQAKDMEQQRKQTQRTRRRNTNYER